MNQQLRILVAAVISTRAHSSYSLHLRVSDLPGIAEHLDIPGDGDIESHHCMIHPFTRGKVVVE